MGCVMQLSRLIICFLLICTSAFAADQNVTCSGDITSALSTAYTNVSNGETINISSGTCSLQSKLTIEKSITITGAGRDSTFITHSAADSNGCLLFENTITGDAVLKDIEFDSDVGS